MKVKAYENMNICVLLESMLIQPIQKYQNLVKQQARIHQI